MSKEQVKNCRTCFWGVGVRDWKHKKYLKTCKECTNPKSDTYELWVKASAVCEEWKSKKGEKKKQSIRKWR